MHIRNTPHTTQYERLAQTLRDRIARGVYARGAKLPSEAELTEDTGLSRSTVRHALELLVEEGLIKKERGRGAFVTGAPVAPENNMVFSSFTAQVEEPARRRQSASSAARTANRAGGSYRGRHEK